MILRLFATDGLTPEKIFRWSVDETAEHLCSQQILWVTRLDTPGWRRLVDWFAQHPSCRAVVLDTANRWDWYQEHEITWRIAQGLCFRPEGVDEIKAVYWGHDDMAPPTGLDFKEYTKAWLASESTVMEAQAYQLWDDFSLVRTDDVGRGLAADCHCWLAKWQPEPKWFHPRNPLTLTYDGPDSGFRPLNSVDPWVSPWPFRHAKGVDKDFRNGQQGGGFVRKGFSKRWVEMINVPCEPYNPDMTWEEFVATPETKDKVRESQKARWQKRKVGQR